MKVEQFELTKDGGWSPAQRTEEEVEAIHDVFGAQTAMTGFCSYGEIGRPEGACLPELHNGTISITRMIEE